MTPFKRAKRSLKRKVKGNWCQVMTKEKRGGREGGEGGGI